MMIPYAPCGTFREVSRTSLAFSPKIARNRRSSAVSSVSPFGVTLPTRISPARTSAPMRMIPRSSRSFSASSPTPGTSLVISSGPSLVSRKKKAAAIIEQFCDRPGKTLIYVTHYPHELPACVDKRFELVKHS